GRGRRTPVACALLTCGRRAIRERADGIRFVLAQPGFEHALQQAGGGKIACNAVVAASDDGLDVARVDPARRALPRSPAQSVHLAVVGCGISGFLPSIRFEHTLDLLAVARPASCSL